jgi:predicted O-methyltransferase YrrM
MINDLHSKWRNELAPDPIAAIYRPSMFWEPERQVMSAWSEHVPFAFWLVDALAPKTIVELGTHEGVSYSAMCQAARELNLPTACFAIDNWMGDEHAGYYSEEVYRDFEAFHDSRYGAFSRLVRSTFDEALPHFADESIDLLHIDGLHTYEAVRHDFESWLPKLSPNAVVLFHDINVRERGFGVFRLWSEISPGKAHFSFLHGHGLGVIGLGNLYQIPLRALFDASRDGSSVASVRSVFASLGRSARLALSLAQQDRRIEVLDRTLAEHVGEIDGLRSEIGNLRDAVAGRDARVGEIVAERDARVGEIVAERDARVGEIDGLRSEIGNLRDAVTERDGRISSLQSTIATMQASSWRSSRPARFASKVKRLAYRAIGR